jgi:hypothetical protein
MDLLLYVLLRKKARWPSGNWDSLGGASDCASAGEEVEDEYDDGQDEKYVDPAAEGVTADHAKQPKDEQNDGDCPKHRFFS